MSMTAEATKWHEKYESMTPMEREVVDSAYKEARRVLEWDSRFKADNLDGAEELVAAITRYYAEGLKRFHE